MKICKKFRTPVWNSVGEFKPGDAIEMKSPVNEFCKKEDLYLVGTIPGCYLRDAKGPGYTDWILQDKVPVTNLRTGGVSLVQEIRPCRGRPNAVVTEAG